MRGFALERIVVLSARRPRRVVRGLGRAFLYLSIYLSLPRAGQHSHFLLPQTVVFIAGIEIDIDRPRFAPSFFATSRVATLLPSILRLFFGDPPREKFVRLEPAAARYDLIWRW